jgi:hypothetical protein
MIPPHPTAAMVRPREDKGKSAQTQQAAAASFYAKLIRPMQNRRSFDADLAC